MPTQQRIVPAETDILCERCGYTLNGLPETSNCPECGEPIANSTSQDGRTLSLYEMDPRPATFWKTTFQVIFQTKRFYRTLKGREETDASQRFARYCRQLTSVGFSICAVLHGIWLITSLAPGPIPRAGFVFAAPFLMLPLVFPITFFLLLGIIRLAEWLTAIEARYWGIRLPQHIVRRAMNFHAASYLLVVLVTTFFIAFHQFTHAMPDTWYLYGLCALVILSAGYLFQTYWIGMKNLMYANR